MTEPSARQPTVHTKGSVNVRVRPSELLLKTRLRVGEATLELRLAKLKALCQMTAEWLKRLGAKKVEFGDPYFSNQAKNDLVRHLHSAARAFTKAPAGGSGRERARDVEVIVTALWDISAMSAEETLILMDRLWFEIIPETEVAETPETALETSRLPAEGNVQEIVNQLIRQLEPGEDPVQFLCISRVHERQIEEAATQAYVQARQEAERSRIAAGEWQASGRVADNQHAT